MRLRTNWSMLIVGLLALTFGSSALGGVLTFYDDRATWLADAATAGLDVTTEAFDVAPAAFPNFEVGAVSFNVPSIRGTYDATNQRIGVIGGGGRTLSFDLTGSTIPVFGFGFDMGPTIGNVTTTDVDGTSLASGQGGAADHFLGVLGTAALDPANPFPSNPALSGSNEFLTSGLGGSVYFDNMSVATRIPEPTSSALLLAVAAIGSATLAARRRK